MRSFLVFRTQGGSELLLARGGKGEDSDFLSREEGHFLAREKKVPFFTCEKRGESWCACCSPSCGGKKDSGLF